MMCGMVGAVKHGLSHDAWNGMDRHRAGWVWGMNTIDVVGPVCEVEGEHEQ
jgi:hypothetical protein